MPADNRMGTQTVTVRLDTVTAARLLDLLCDNPREWNNQLRTTLTQFVSATDSYNAALARKKEN